MKNRPIVGILLLFIIATVACRTAPVRNVTASSVPAGLTADQVGDAIEKAARRRGWYVERQGPGEMIASLDVRGRHKAIVDIAYDPTSYSITYRDSENLRYNGQRIHRNYNGWIVRLEGTIRDEFIRALP